MGLCRAAVARASRSFIGSLRSNLKPIVITRDTRAEHQRVVRASTEHVHFCQRDNCLHDKVGSAVTARADLSRSPGSHRSDFRGLDVSMPMRAGRFLDARSAWQTLEAHAHGERSAIRSSATSRHASCDCRDARASARRPTTSRQSRLDLTSRWNEAICVACARTATTCAAACRTRRSSSVERTPPDRARSTSSSR